jgi:hypothetical protein
MLSRKLLIGTSCPDRLIGSINRLRLLAYFYSKTMISGTPLPDRMGPVDSKTNMVRPPPAAAPRADTFH